MPSAFRIRQVLLGLLLIPLLLVTTTACTSSCTNIHPRPAPHKIRGSVVFFGDFMAGVRHQCEIWRADIIEFELDAGFWRHQETPIQHGCSP